LTIAAQSERRATESQSFSRNAEAREPDLFALMAG